MNTNSRLYQELTPLQLEEICRHYLGQPLKESRLLSGGLFNTTYLLTTEESRVVLRLGPVNRQLLMPYEENLMEAEALVVELFRKNAIPTSRILAVDTSRALLDRDLMLVEYIPSAAMSAVELDGEGEARLCREVGALCRRIHSIPAPEHLTSPYGRVASVLAGQGRETWREAVLAELARWRRCAERAALFPKEILDRVDGCFQRFSPLLDIPGLTPRLVHGDLWYGNILVDAEQKLAAVIDGDRAFFGDPEFELATGWMTGASFCQGYGRDPDPSEPGQLRRKIYKLLLDLEDCYVLMTEYNDSENGEALKLRIQETLAQLEKQKI